MISPELVIDARGLVKDFGEVQALRGLDLSVERGTVLGVLGPNGAGKTTAVRILSTLLEADAGSATVVGFDVRTHGAQVRARIGLTGQYAAVDEFLTGRENLVMFGRLHRLGKDAARRRADELLDRFDLSEAGDRVTKGYSGGMRRRLDLAASLVVEPDVLFLDEPTTGLDPRSRLSVWEIVERLAKSGTTVLLTTQYLEEADRLSDRIVVIDEGRAIAEGTSDELKARVGGDRIEIEAADTESLERVRAALRDMADAEPVVEERELRAVAPLAEGARRLIDVARALDAAGANVASMSVRQPTLDDVFLQLTGHTADDAEAGSRTGPRSSGESEGGR